MNGEIFLTADRYGNSRKKTRKYYLYGAYRNFDAVMYRTCVSLSVLAENWPQETVAKIYGDDVLLYEGSVITQRTYGDIRSISMFPVCRN